VVGGGCCKPLARKWYGFGPTMEGDIQLMDYMDDDLSEVEIFGVSASHRLWKVSSCGDG
jgi:hypothetical protein